MTLLHFYALRSEALEVFRLKTPASALRQHHSSTATRQHSSTAAQPHGSTAAPQHNHTSARQQSSSSPPPNTTPAAASPLFDSGDCGRVGDGSCGEGGRLGGAPEGGGVEGSGSRSVGKAVKGSGSGIVGDKGSGSNDKGGGDEGSMLRGGLVLFSAGGLTQGVELPGLSMVLQVLRVYHISMHSLTTHSAPELLHDCILGLHVAGVIAPLVKVGLLQIRTMTQGVERLGLSMVLHVGLHVPLKPGRTHVTSRTQVWLI